MQKLGDFLNDIDTTKLDINSFGTIIDEFLDKSEMIMQISSLEGSHDVDIADNLGLGPVMHFYVLLRALVEVLKEFSEFIGVVDKDFIDECLDIVRDELLYRLENEKGGAEKNE